MTSEGRSEVLKEVLPHPVQRDSPLPAQKVPTRHPAASATIGKKEQDLTVSK